MNYFLPGEIIGRYIKNCICLYDFSMVLGGVPIIGLFSLINYFTFLPPGGSCGVVFSLSPLEVSVFSNGIFFFFFLDFAKYDF